VVVVEWCEPLQRICGVAPTFFFFQLGRRDLLVVARPLFQEVPANLCLLWLSLLWLWFRTINKLILSIQPTIENNDGASNSIDFGHRREY
jgi:hypothetical protein